ncbi:serine hydrolase [Salininema proteolyticum]|uniref:Beta-lactamase class A n=1 Tax=Salininema proteolyticum TaxID=1607685 RepID=A0ABV8U2L5_9ACTN
MFDTRALGNILRRGLTASAIVALLLTEPSASSPDDDPGAFAELEGEYSVAVYDRSEDEFLIELDEDRPRAALSIIKIPIAIEALENGADEEEVATMLRTSDDAIASDYWVEYGGPLLIEDFREDYGLQDMTQPVDWEWWGMTELSARDTVKIYRHVVEELDADHREVILGALRDMENEGADGFPQDFGIAEAADDRPWAVKQGWACCDTDRELATTGLVGEDFEHIIVIQGHWHGPVNRSEATADITKAAEIALATIDNA